MLIFPRNFCLKPDKKDINADFALQKYKFVALPLRPATEVITAIKECLFIFILFIKLLIISTGCKKLILIFMLTCILPLTLSAMVCSGTMTSTTAEAGDESKLDNSTHNNCVNADKAAWAVDKIYFYTDEYCTEGKQTLTLTW